MLTLYSNQTNQAQELMEMAVRVRSIRGSSIPQPLIDKLGELCYYQDFDFVVNDGSELSRTKSFFEDHRDDFFFLNQYGKPFDFDDSAKEIVNNELFLAIDFNCDNRKATFYVYFPYDGAYI